MSSHARSSREEERRLSVRTLIFASVGSATAAIITSQFWGPGTPIAAAMTPVIVALVSELLRRPTERITSRVTTDTRVARDTDVLPEAAGAGPPPREEERRPRPAREAPMAEGPRVTSRRPPPRGGPPPGRRGEPEFRVHRSTARASRLPWRVILATAGIAFAVAVAFLTLPELLAGESFLRDDRETTFFGGGRGDRGASLDDQPTVTEEAPARRPESEGSEQTTPAPPTTPEETTPTTPQTTTQPAQPPSSPPAAPEP